MKMGISVSSSHVGHCGIDVRDKLTSILSEELARSIDLEILKGFGILAINEKRKRSIEKILSKII